ncbi:MAG: CoA transferase [Janthinobacterium lividum]
MGDLLHRAWRDLGGAPQRLTCLRVTGWAELPARLPVARFAVDTVAVQLLAAADLAAADVGSAAQAAGHRHDRGDDCEVVVDATHVGYSFRSERFLRIAGRAAGVEFAPLSRFAPAADGWVRLHANYPHHAAALHDALGSHPLEAISASGRFDVEESVIAAGGVAAAVRTPGEWSAHPAALAVASAPLIDLRQVSGSASIERSGPPRWEPPHPPHVRGGDPRTSMTGLLTGLRVLDLTRVIAGPVATRTLASYGADVVRVEHPDLPEDHATLLETGAGKRCTAYDLAHHVDRRRFAELLGGADVLVHGYRPGALARQGLQADTLAADHPHLIVASLSAWGTTGPWGGRRGFDSIVQAATGIAHLTGTGSGATPPAAPHGRRPGTLPAQALDHGGGHLLAAAVLRALDVTRRQGGTWHAQLSLAGLAHQLLTPPRHGALGGARPGTPAVIGDAEPYLLDLTGDGQAISVVAPPGSPPWGAGIRRTRPHETRWHPVIGDDVLDPTRSRGT